jgi:predicted membrane chloride channel (bestrophin family)
MQQKCLQVLSELVEAADITEMQRWQMHKNLTTLHDVLGGCERILRTPIPVAYTRHTSRFVILWMTFLPYAIWEKFGWATLAVALFIGVLLLGINEIGIDVEEPFSLLPLEAITDRAFQDCKQSINMQV